MGEARSVIRGQPAEVPPPVSVLVVTSSQLAALGQRVRLECGGALADRSCADRLAATETKRMSEWFDTDRAEPTPSPRCSVRFDSDGTWSAWRGAILLASGLPTVTAACDVLDRAASARPPATPMRLPTAPRRWRGSRA